MDPITIGEFPSQCCFILIEYIYINKSLSTSFRVVSVRLNVSFKHSDMRQDPFLISENLDMMISFQCDLIDIAFFFASMSLDSFQLINSFRIDLSDDTLSTDYIFLAFDLNKILIRTNIFKSVLCNSQYICLHSDCIICGFFFSNIRP